MRLTLVVALLGFAACAPRSAAPVSPVRYACADMTFTRGADGIATGDATSGRSWRDDAGEHLLLRTPPATDGRAIELVAPADPQFDAVRNTYDTSRGSSRASWSLVDRQVCTAEGGHTDVMARWTSAAYSFDQLARELQVDRDEARRRVRKAISTLQHQYFAAR